MKKLKIFLILFFIMSSFFTIYGSYDACIVGNIDVTDGIGQHALSFVNCLHDSVSLQCVKFFKYNTSGLAPHIQAIVKKAINPKLLKENKIFDDHGIVIYTSILQKKIFDGYLTLKVPSTALRFVYAVAEREIIPEEFIQRINNNFDAMLVADPFLVDVYKKSGVIKPIFVLPLSVLLGNFLDASKDEFKAVVEKGEKLADRKKAKKVFAFGCSSTFILRKNHELVIDAFNQEFGDDYTVELRIHGRYGDLFQNLQKKIRAKNISNIKLLNTILDPIGYKTFITSLDCYILASMGEGFSISPRQALAAGIPCILSDNTAHKEICSTGFVYAVPSFGTNQSPLTLLKEKDRFLSFDFDCDIMEIRKALREVYNNYAKYKKLALKSRNWVKKYTPQGLKSRYKNLIKPKQILFGFKDEITFF